MAAQKLRDMLDFQWFPRPRHPWWFPDRHHAQALVESAVVLTPLKAKLRNTLIGGFVRNLRQRGRDRRELAFWEKAGKPIPAPHVVKQHILSIYASTFRTGVLIETGTFLGQMVYAMRDRFQTIVSIELSHDLANEAKRRFRAYPHIRILQGDSGEALPQVLSNVSTQCLFWLDGHYSGGITAKGKTDTPVWKELKTILEHKIENHVILVDDARCFDGTQGYPTLNELRELVALNRPNYDFSVSNDVIRIHPKTDVPTEF